jgi:hypothetical protein
VSRSCKCAHAIAQFHLCVCSYNPKSFRLAKQCRLLLLASKVPTSNSASKIALIKYPLYNTPNATAVHTKSQRDSLVTKRKETRERLATFTMYPSTQVNSTPTSLAAPFPWVRTRSRTGAVEEDFAHLAETAKLKTLSNDPQPGVLPPVCRGSLIKLQVARFIPDDFEFTEQDIRIFFFF